METSLRIRSERSPSRSRVSSRLLGGHSNLARLPNRAHQFSELLESNPIWVIGYAAVAVLFAAGETQRRDKLPRLPQLKPAQVPLFVIGVALLVVWFLLFRFEILANLENILADPIPLVAGIVAIPLVSLILVKYYTRGGRKAIV